MYSLGEIPASEIKFVGGSLAKPRTWGALAHFKKLQLAVNRFSKAAGFTAIRDDGDFGSSTTAAVKKTANFVKDRYGGASSIDIIQKASLAKSPKDYVYEADRLGSLLEGIANSMGMPRVYIGADGPSPPKASSSSPSEEISVSIPETGPSIAGFPISLPVIAVAGLGLYVLFMRGGKKKGRARRKRRR